jgi:hypothetical protein
MSHLHFESMQRPVSNAPFFQVLIENRQEVGTKRAWIHEKNPKQPHPTKKYNGDGKPSLPLCTIPLPQGVK